MSSGWDLIPKSTGWLNYSQYLIRMTYGHYRMSSGWLTMLSYVIRMRWLIWILSHPDDLTILSISSGWLMPDALCHPDDLAGVGISSGCVMANTLCHPYDLTEVGISSGWHTLPFLSHPDEIANFDFPQHAVVLQRYRKIAGHLSATTAYCWFLAQ